jgi:hypothetical protein
MRRLPNASDVSSTHTKEVGTMTGKSPEIDDTEGHRLKRATEDPQSPDVEDDTEGHILKR